MGHHRRLPENGRHRSISMLEGGKRPYCVILCSLYNHMEVSTTRPMAQVRVGKHLVGRNVLIIEKSLTSGSQKVVTTFDQNCRQSMENNWCPYIRASNPNKTKSLSFHIKKTT